MVEKQIAALKNLNLTVATAPANLQTLLDLAWAVDAVQADSPPAIAEGGLGACVWNGPMGPTCCNLTSNQCSSLHGMFNPNTLCTTGTPTSMPPALTSAQISQAIVALIGVLKQSTPMDGPHIGTAQHSLQNALQDLQAVPA